MKKRFKKLYLMIMTSLAFMFFSTTYVSATIRGFNGSAGYSYARVSERNVKTDKNGIAWVNWTGSSTSSHKMWFQVVNNEDANRGKSLLSYKSEKLFSTSATYNYGYWLRASREHLFNPSVNVNGTWEP